MSAPLGIVQKIQSLLPSLSICARIAIGNSVIIIIGALAGTYVTRSLTEKGEELAFLLLIVAFGLLVSIAINYLIIRAALRPLTELQRSLEQMQAGQLGVSLIKLRNPDPQSCQIATTIGGLAGQLEDSNQRLRATSRRTVHAQEEERKRIAGWLHDDTGQALVTLTLKLERLKNHLPEDDLENRTRLDEAHKIAQQALDSLRKVITGLRPAILDDLGLLPAIRWYARTNLEEAGIRVHFDFPEEAFELPAEIDTTLFRVTQECVNNIVRHSKAQNASISLRNSPAEIYLCVEDDGRGFIVENLAAANDRQHWGLMGIQERISLVGGTLNLASQPEHGCLLEICIPLPRLQEAELG